MSINNQEMQNQSPSEGNFLSRLFDSLLQSKRSSYEDELSKMSFDEIQDESFFSQFRTLLQTCKTNLKNLCAQQADIEEHIARKIINTLLYLNKDAWTLLQDALLNMYMDLVEMKEKKSIQKGPQSLIDFLQNCISIIEPLLYYFFAYKEYRKLQPAEVEKQRKVSKTVSITKKSSVNSYSSDSNFDEKPQSSTLLNYMDEPELLILRQSMRKFKINELLLNYLNDYEMEINQLQEQCKICSKHIKINHLQQHVEYCQKKYIFKQDLSLVQSKITSLAQLLIRRGKQSIQKQQQNQQIENLNYTDSTVMNEKYEQILCEILDTHKIDSFKIPNSKKIQSQTFIKENMDKYEQLLNKINSYLDQLDQNDENKDDLNHFAHFEKEIIHLVNKLRTLELQHQNLKEIGSSSTIRLPSNSSAQKMDQKKSRFACKKNRSKSQKGSQKGDPDVHDFEFITFQNFDLESQQDSEEEGNSQNANGKLKNKQSFNNDKLVHFNDNRVEQKEETVFARDCRKKKSRKVKSLAMLDSDSEQEDQKVKSENNSKALINEGKSSCPSKRPDKICLNDFEILKYLGKGAFGKVYAVKKKDTRDLYALKMIDIEQDWGYDQFQQITNQHEIFKKVAGEHLVQAPFCFSEGCIHAFIMEFMPGGDLGKILQDEVYLQEDRAKFVLAEIVLALQHLHKADIIHRDLKPENLVIDEKGHLKLTDFGLSEIKIQNKMTSIKNETRNDKRRQRRTGMVTSKDKINLIGTPDYIAPQIINGISITNQSIDWWSLGVITYQILIGARPFSGNSIEEVVDNILRFQIQWPQIGDEEGMISQKAYDLINRLLDKDFVNRLGAKDVNQIKQHPFFQGVDWENIKQQQASIMPNYAILRLLEDMGEDEELKQEISAKASKKLQNFKAPQLDNFIRFDFLGEKTMREAQRRRSKRTGTLMRLQSIKDLIGDKQSEPSYTYRDLDAAFGF